MQRRRLALLGALVGLALTIPLTALMYLGTQVTDGFLPFAATDPMQTLTRIQLFGGLVTKGIDVMVGLFHDLPGVSTDVASKQFEQILAILFFLALGTLVGAIYAVYKNRLNQMGSLTIGLIAWMVALGMQFALMPAASDRLPVVGLWLGILYIFWGIALGWTIHKLVAFEPTTAEANMGRRQFLTQFGGSVLAVTIGAWGLGSILGRSKQTTSATISTANIPTPAVGQSPTQSASSKLFIPAPGTRPEVTDNKDFYRVDVNIYTPPALNEKTWTLAVSGVVNTPLSISYDDLLKMPPTHLDATLECISNPVGGDLISSTRWTGIKLRDVLTQAGLKDTAIEIKFTCADGYTESLPLESAMNEATLLAYATNGEAISTEHGFPLRLYTPNRYGMKNPKWITEIEVLDTPYNGYWEDRGWVKEAFVKSTSVIDTIATDHVENGEIPVGGIAFAGSEGISKVEIAVDGGPWQAADLKDPISPLTWRFWRWNWKADKGSHELRVRTFNNKGEQQIEEIAGLHPSGASGFHSKRINIS
jgi:DMSO/TMAO reductase YedYZ molybdopterin-dependent catalytic subunit